jgi:protein phosphatase
MLTRALGVDEDVEVSLYEGETRSGDRFLLATDGLTGMVPEWRLEELLRRFADPAEAAERLLDAANEAGGLDNITAVVVDIPGQPAAR